MLLPFLPILLFLLFLHIISSFHFLIFFLIFLVLLLFYTFLPFLYLFLLSFFLFLMPFLFSPFSFLFDYLQYLNFQYVHFTIFCPSFFLPVLMSIYSYFLLFFLVYFHGCGFQSIYPPFFNTYIIMYCVDLSEMRYDTSFSLPTASTKKKFVYVNKYVHYKSVV